MHSKSNLLKGFILTLSELNSDDIHSLTFGGDSIETLESIKGKYGKLKTLAGLNEQIEGELLILLGDLCKM